NLMEASDLSRLVRHGHDCWEDYLPRGMLQTLPKLLLRSKLEWVCAAASKQLRTWCKLAAWLFINSRCHENYYLITTMTTSSCNQLISQMHSTPSTESASTAPSKN